MTKGEVWSSGVLKKSIDFSWVKSPEGSENTGDYPTLLFTGWPAGLADHHNVIFFMVLTIIRAVKSGHLLHWPDHWLICGPLPKDDYPTSKQ